MCMYLVFFFFFLVCLEKKWQINTEQLYVSVVKVSVFFWFGFFFFWFFETGFLCIALAVLELTL